MEVAMVSASMGVIKSVLAKFSTLLEKKYKLIKDVKKDIISLRDEMRSMNALLVKLCEMESLDVQQKEWRDKVRELTYDTEDCIDIFMHKIGEGGAEVGILNRLKEVKARYKIAGLIQELKSRAVEVSDHRSRYKLDEGISGSSGHRAVAIDPRVQALYVEAANLLGIDEPRSKIVKWLMEDGENNQQLKVVSIIGSGGMGKTTLANQVYIKCKQHFDCTAFISVSQNPDLNKVLTDLLSELGYPVPPFDYYIHGDEKKLIDKLRKGLKDKRYLIVIDDLWRAEAWNIIKCSFVENNHGSRVIITTRIENIAKTCSCSSTDHIYKIKPLNDPDSRKLFHRRIFHTEDTCPDHLKEVSDNILKKCGGVPLAILSVASILASHEEVHLKRNWDKIHEFLGIQLETNPALEWMGHVLSLSYIDLSVDLKTCMLYLGIFPEDYKIMKDYLIKRWVAEGFVGEKYGCSQDEVAESYFNELVNRSIIQIAGFDDCGEVISCRVHDVMLEFILSKSTEENFMTIINDQHSTKCSFEVRRLSVQVKSSECDHHLANIILTQVRSFNFWGPAQFVCSLAKFQLLRVLCIDLSVSNDYQYDVSTISNLFQLTYLRTRGIKCKNLIPQLQKLQHLKTLEIFDDYGLDILQLDIRKSSPTLWHLNVPADVELVGGISRMQALRTLATVPLTDVESIKEIGQLSNLKDLSLCGNSSCKQSTYGKLLKSLCKLGICSLQSLIIRPKYLFGLEDITLQPDFLTCWSPPPRHLCRLHVLNCPFSVIPKWISVLEKLRSLKIQIVALTSDGVEVLAKLPSLVHLSLVVKDHVPEGGVVICSTAFQNLKDLWFNYKVPCLTFEAGAMPRLLSLSIDCYARGVQLDNGILAGVEHLGNLKSFKVLIRNWSSDTRSYALYSKSPQELMEQELERCDIQNLKAALQEAISKHLGRPDISIDFW